MSPFLDPAYQMQRASGERYVASTYVSADVDEFEIVGVLETRPADGLVVARYAARTPGATTADTSMVLSGDLAPRLTVFHWDDAAGHWKVLSHATFNTPIAAICEQDALAPPSFPEVSTREEDVALGVKLVEEYAQLAVDGDTRPMLDPQVQVQAGNGRGYTTAAEWIPTKFSAVDLADFLVTRNDDVLVVACTAVQAGLALGEAAGSAPEPRLTTFRLDESGAWKVVAHANFVEASALPDGAECVPAG